VRIDKRLFSLAVLACTALQTHQALATEPVAATGELRGCIHADGQLPAGLKAIAIPVTNPSLEPSPLPLNGGCFAAMLPKGIYLVRAKAAGWTGQAPLVKLDGQAQRDLKLITEKGSKPALADQLAAMEKADQGVRQHIDFSDKAAMKKMTDVDKQNLAELRRIIDIYGWPSAELVGYEGAEHCWVLVQHASYELMKETLPAMKAAAGRGELAPGNVALTIDRVLVHEGKKQLYGSQFKQTASGEMEADPIEDPAHLDERRAQMGLGPFEEYRAAILKMYPAAKQP
jgi:hypothetical protein